MNKYQITYVVNIVIYSFFSKYTDNYKAINDNIYEYTQLSTLFNIINKLHLLSYPIKPLLFPYIEQQLPKSIICGVNNSFTTMLCGFKSR